MGGTKGARALDDLGISGTNTWGGDRGSNLDGGRADHVPGRRTMKVNDGGPAYPNHSNICGNTGGMSPRDWFAAHETLSEWENPEVSIGDKMATALAGEPKPQGGWAEDPLGMLRWEAKWRAALKYIRADAMLAEREKRGGE